jgi:hypothetical protein
MGVKSSIFYYALETLRPRTPRRSRHARECLAYTNLLLLLLLLNPGGGAGGGGFLLNIRMVN